MKNSLETKEKQLLFRSVPDPKPDCRSGLWKNIIRIGIQISQRITIRNPDPQHIFLHVVAVYNVTILAIGLGLSKKFWPMVTYDRKKPHLKLCRPAYCVRTTQLWQINDNIIFCYLPPQFSTAVVMCLLPPTNN